MKIKRIFYIKDNVVECDANIFREVATTEEQCDKIIKHIVKINKNILKTHNTFVYKISLESVNLLDVRYASFFIKLIKTLQKKFRYVLEKLHLTNTSLQFTYCWSIISYVIYPDVLSKIQIS